MRREMEPRVTAIYQFCFFLSKEKNGRFVNSWQKRKQIELNHEPQSKFLFYSELKLLLLARIVADKIVTYHQVLPVLSPKYSTLIHHFHCSPPVQVSILSYGTSAELS